MVKHAYPTPQRPQLPYKREFTKEEAIFLYDRFGRQWGWSKIDSRGHIVLNGGEEHRGIYYITEEQLKEEMLKNNS